jgi:hypothetical protein
MQKIKIDSLEKIFSRKQLVFFGLLSILVSLAFFASSGLMIKSAVDFVKAEDNSGSAISSRACVNYLNQMESGLTVNQEESNHISVASNGLKNASLKLSQASIASVVCPGWELSDFCMGESCSKGEGLYFDLRIIDKLNQPSKVAAASTGMTPAIQPDAFAPPAIGTRSIPVPTDTTPVRAATSRRR